jgi:class 3 adenylate cyclase
LSEKQRRLAAIVFTDIVGYAALAQADEAGTLELLEKHRQLLRPLFSKHAGKEIKTIGDAFLVEFGSALEATLCALISRVLFKAAILNGARSSKFA